MSNHFVSNELVEKRIFIIDIVKNRYIFQQLQLIFIIDL